MIDHNVLNALVAFFYYLKAPNLRTTGFLYPIYQKINELIFLHLTFIGLILIRWQYTSFNELFRDGNHFWFKNRFLLLLIFIFTSIFV